MMTESIKEVEYVIKEIITDRGVARVQFINPYKTGKKDDHNVDTEREVIIPIDEDTGKADADAFKNRLEQHAMAQSNKMLMKSKETKRSEAMFADILKMDKSILVDGGKASKKKSK